MKRKAIICTICIVHKNNRILLGMKKRGFGVGKWNGFGGKVHNNETVLQAAKRELQEECGLVVKKLTRIGILNFEFRNGGEMKTFLYKATEFSGKLIETEEMKPKWFPIDKIPFKKMWDDDRHWMPLFLRNKKFKSKFTFDKNLNLASFSIIRL